MTKETPSISKVEMMVIDATANDYENFESIAQQVKEWAVEEAISCSQSTIRQAIKDAIHKGLVGVFRYSEQAQSFEPSSQSGDDFNEFYFLATTEGRSILDQ